MIRQYATGVRRDVTARIRDLVLGFDPELPVERACTPPSAWYRDPELYALECASALRRSWHAVARTADLPGPGCYLACELQGEPLVLVRDEGGALRGFFNVCRHHAARMLDGRGRCDAIVCPYHGWTYELAGRLVRAPRLGAVAELDRAGLDLVPVALAELGPLLLVCLDAASAPPPPRLHEPLGELCFVAERRHELACNWKVVVENYLDGGYHVPVLHGGLASGLDLDSYCTRIDGDAVTQTVAARPGDARLGERAAYTWYHPTLMFNRYGPVLDVNRVIPLGPVRTAIAFDFFFEPQAAADAAFVERALAQSDAIQQEDTRICERVQQGLGSASFTRGRYAPSLEHGAHHFHRLLARALRHSLSA